MARPKTRQPGRRRRGARRKAQHPVFYETLEGAKGSAMLIEVSYSGARLAAGEPRPGPGELVRLYLWPQGQAEPFEVSGNVVGRRSDGFALAFVNAGQELCQWVDALQTALPEPESASEPEPEPEPAAGAAEGRG